MKIKGRLISSVFLLLMGIGFTLTTAKSYGQLIAQKNHQSTSKNELVHYTAGSRMEHSDIEYWMIVPFLHSFGEEEIFMESWMTIPFMDELGENELVLESWMAVPFSVQ